MAPLPTCLPDCLPACFDACCLLLAARRSALAACFLPAKLVGSALKYALCPIRVSLVCMFFARVCVSLTLSLAVVRRRESHLDATFHPLESVCGACQLRILRVLSDPLAWTRPTSWRACQAATSEPVVLPLQIFRSGPKTSSLFIPELSKTERPHREAGG